MPYYALCLCLYVYALCLCPILRSISLAYALCLACGCVFRLYIKLEKSPLKSKSLFGLVNGFHL